MYIYIYKYIYICIYKYIYICIYIYMCIYIYTANSTTPVPGMVISQLECPTGVGRLRLHSLPQFPISSGTLLLHFSGWQS